MYLKVHLESDVGHLAQRDFVVVNNWIECGEVGGGATVLKCIPAV